MTGNSLVGGEDMGRVCLGWGGVLVGVIGYSSGKEHSLSLSLEINGPSSKSNEFYWVLMPLKFLLSKFKFIGIFSVGVSSQTFKGHTHRVFDAPSPFPLLTDSVGQPVKKEKNKNSGHKTNFFTTTLSV